mgnify:CR=1 FL=1
MVNLTRFWTGAAQPADSLRYGRGKAAPDSAQARRPIVVWNITRTCNLRCIHCYSDSGAKQYPGELNWEQMQAVVDDLADYQIPSLLLSGGEPLVHPRFFDLVKYASDKGLKLTISTNGKLLSPDNAERLAAIGNVAYVGISLDGIGDVYDHFRGKIGAFKAAVNGFRACEKAGLKTGLRLTLTRHNASSIDDILDFAEEQEIQRVCFYHLVPAGRGVDLQGLPPELARKAINTVLARIERWEKAGVTREILTVAQPADGVYLYLRQRQEQRGDAENSRQLLVWNGGEANSFGSGIANIDPVGNVHPDQFWQETILGNIKTQRFSYLWEERVGEAAHILPKLRSLASLSVAERKENLNGRYASCRHFDICGGGFRTRAATAAAGDIWSSDPGCYLTDEEILECV